MRRLEMSASAHEPLDSERFLCTVGEDRTIIHSSSGNILYNQGDVAKYVFYLQQGRVNIVSMSSRRKAALVRGVLPGWFFGEGCLAERGRYGFSAVAASESIVTRIGQSRMRQSMRDHPELAEFFLSSILEQNARMEADVADLILNASELRLARALLLLAGFEQGDSDQQPIDRCSQEELAQIVGTTRPRISHFLNGFRRMGHIHYDGTIVVHRSLLNLVSQSLAPSARILRVRPERAECSATRVIPEGGGI